ncbi:hypothetical protein ACK32R_04240 [Aeromonas dhakensis]|uniref:hypothetical protein n=1 Tax=Aeromonas dhakensis TaxID=196024 RepID=UPI0039864554
MTNSNDDNSLSGSFTQLFVDFRPKNLTQVVRRLYPSLIKARNDGYNSPQLAKILSKLMEQDVSPDNLRATLHRIKNERAAKGVEGDELITKSSDPSGVGINKVDIKPEVRKYNQRQAVMSDADHDNGLGVVADTLVSAPSLSDFKKPK